MSHVSHIMWHTLWTGNNFDIRCHMLRMSIWISFTFSEKEPRIYRALLQKNGCRAIYNSIELFIYIFNSDIRRRMSRVPIWHTWRLSFQVDRLSFRVYPRVERVGILSFRVDTLSFRIDSLLESILSDNLSFRYGVATMSRMLKNICLFAEYRSLL